jgi:hypothetical protein
MARMYDYYLGGCFYRAKRTEGNTISTACRMVMGIRFAVFARRLPPGRFSFHAVQPRMADASSTSTKPGGLSVA